MRIESRESQPTPHNPNNFYIGDIANFANRRGWFMGHFIPEGELLHRNDVELAVMDLPTTDPARMHSHRFTTEITYCISGKLNLLIGDPPQQITLIEGQLWLYPLMSRSKTPPTPKGLKSS